MKKIFKTFLICLTSMALIVSCASDEGTTDNTTTNSTTTGSSDPFTFMGTCSHISPTGTVTKLKDQCEENYSDNTTAATTLQTMCTALNDGSTWSTTAKCTDTDKIAGGFCNTAGDPSIAQVRLYFYITNGNYADLTAAKTDCADASGITGTWVDQ